MTYKSHADLEAEHYQLVQKSGRYCLEGMMDLWYEEMSFYRPYREKNDALESISRAGNDGERDSWSLYQRIASLEKKTEEQWGIIQGLRAKAFPKAEDRKQVGQEESVKPVYKHGV